jgi:hypothetical protein
MSECEPEASPRITTLKGGGLWLTQAYKDKSTIT